MTDLMSDSTQDLVERLEWDAEGKSLCRSFQHDSDGWLWCRFAVLDTAEKAKELADALNTGAAALRSHEELVEALERIEREDDTGPLMYEDAPTPGNPHRIRCVGNDIGKSGLIARQALSSLDGRE